MYIMKMSTRVSRNNPQSLGIIFHWGLYSVPAYHEKKSNKEGNGSEWYQKRFLEDGKWRPIGGYKQTQEYHKENYGDMPYENFSDLFLAEKWNPDEWMQLCKSVGATYVILTAKHHDGYCLWPTKTTDYNSFKTGPKRDLIYEFSESAKKYGLIWGVYYSWSEFTKSCTQEYMNKFMIPQVRELLKYNPQIWWADGDWACTTKISCATISKLVAKMKNKNPDILVNDRLGCSKELKEQKFNMNYLGDATFRNYRDRWIALLSPNVPWESIQTIGNSWGRNKMQTQYKTSEKLFELYQQTISMGGNFLLNLGPNADGTLDPMEKEILEKFGQYIIEK